MLTYTYDPASQVTNILHQLTATSSQINKADYVYNGVGNRTSLTDRRGPQTFGCDQLDRLTTASHPLLLDPQAFAYDAVGNRTTGGSVVNPGNQLTADTIPDTIPPAISPRSRTAKANKPPFSTISSTAASKPSIPMPPRVLSMTPSGG